MMQFSCAEYAFPRLSPARRFDLLHLLGFSHVDLGLFERSAGLRPSELLADRKTFVKRLKADLQHARLEVSDVFLQTSVDPAKSAVNSGSAAARARNRKAFLQALDLCAALGCMHMTGLPGVRHKGVSKADDWLLAVEEAGWRQQRAQSAGVTYAIEAHLGSICPSVDAARRFAESAPGLTLSLDYGHFIWANAGSREIHSLLPLASHVHARGGAPGRLQTPVSENAIDFRGMIQRLRKLKYGGFVALEYVWTEWQQCNRTDNVSETILLRRLLEEALNGRAKTAAARKRVEPV